MTFVNGLTFALRSLARAKGVSVTIVGTLALGIGANAAIFSVVRGVLLRPLVNRDESRLSYIQHGARGIGTKNATFSVPAKSSYRMQYRPGRPHSVHFTGNVTDETIAEYVRLQGAEPQDDERFRIAEE